MFPSQGHGEGTVLFQRRLTAQVEGSCLQLAPTGGPRFPLPHPCPRYVRGGPEGASCLPWHLPLCIDPRLSLQEDTCPLEETPGPRSWSEMCERRLSVMYLLCSWQILHG